MSKKKNVWNGDDEFSFNFGPDEEGYDMYPIIKRKKKPKSKPTKKKRVSWVKIGDGVYQNLDKISDGVYQNLAKLRAEEKPKKKRKPKKKKKTYDPDSYSSQLFKGLGSSSRGPRRWRSLID